MCPFATQPDACFGGEEAGLGQPETARFAVIPAPLEHTVSYGGGTGEGPSTLIRASAELEFFCDETFRPYWPDGAVVTTRPPFERGVPSLEALEALEAVVRDTLERGMFPICIGGEHALTYAPVRALQAEGHAFGVLFVDAHLDLRDEYGGSKWSHASVGRRIVEDLGIPCSWIGVRSVSREEHDVVTAREFVVSYGHQARTDLEAQIARVLAALPDKVYLTFDVDGLDPSILPGTGTPEPGGLTYPQALEILRTVASKKTLIGADFVELAPIPEQQVSEFTTAKLVAKLLGELTR